MTSTYSLLIYLMYHGSSKVAKYSKRDRYDYEKEL